jgi:hypothetical protein
MSIPTYLDYIRCVAQSHWKIPAFGYINNQDHRLVEPGQIFDERDTSDPYELLAVLFDQPFWRGSFPEPVTVIKKLKEKMAGFEG